MKEVILLGFMKYGILLLAIWIAIIFVANRATLRTRPFIRLFIVSLAMLSVPSYLFLGAWYTRYSYEKKLGQERVIAESSNLLFKRICSEKPIIKVYKVVQHSTPIDLRVSDYDTNGLQIFFSPDPSPKPGFRKWACWLEKDFASCKRSNIGNVEWSYQASNYLSCNPNNNCIKSKYFKNDRNGNDRIAIDAFSSQYGLQIFKAERIDQLIDKFNVSVRDIRNGEVYAETSIYRKTWNFSYLGRTKTEADEIWQCPANDVQIADMLSKVFPVH